MAASLTSCELVSTPDHVVLLLKPAVTQSSWAEVEAFGSDVLEELEHRESPACLVDLTGLSYIGSSTVALLVRVWKVIQARSGRMVVACSHSTVLEVIRLAGLDKVWTLVDDVEQARKRLGVHRGNGSAPKKAGAASSPRIWYFAMGAATALIVALLLLAVLNQ